MRRCIKRNEMWIAVVGKYIYSYDKANAAGV
jgi:hypothetical protein